MTPSETSLSNDSVSAASVTFSMSQERLFGDGVAQKRGESASWDGALWSDRCKACARSYGVSGV
jgi:hypothetical protein